MTAFFSALRRTAPKQLAAIAALPLLATSLVSTPALAANPTTTPAEATTVLNTHNLYAQVSGLSGTWRATDASVLHMLDLLYGPSGAVPERITGSIYATFSPDGIVTVTYDNLTLFMPESESIPPITLRGSLNMTYAESAPGVLAFTGQSHTLEAEVMGFTMPAPEVPNATTPTGYSLSGESLTFSNLNGDPVYFPGSWLRTY